MQYVRYPKIFFWKTMKFNFSLLPSKPYLFPDEKLGSIVPCNYIHRSFKRNLSNSKKNFFPDRRPKQLFFSQLIIPRNLQNSFEILLNRRRSKKQAINQIKYENIKKEQTFKSRLVFLIRQHVFADVFNFCFHFCHLICPCLEW